MPNFEVMRRETVTVEVMYSVEADDVRDVIQRLNHGEGDETAREDQETLDSLVISIVRETDDGDPGRELFYDTGCMVCGSRGVLGIKLGNRYECCDCQKSAGFEDVPKDLLILLGEPR